MKKKIDEIIKKGTKRKNAFSNKNLRKKTASLRLKITMKNFTKTKLKKKKKKFKEERKLN